MTPFSQKIVSLACLAIIFSLESRGAFLPVCQRTPQVRQVIEEELHKTCDKIEEGELLSLIRVAPEGMGITQFQKEDFSGLKNLEILNIRSNPFTELPEGLFDDLGKLKTLVIISGKLRHYPDDFLAKTPLIENLHTFRIGVRTLSESMLSRLAALKNLQILDYDQKLQEPERNRLRQIFPANGKVELSFY